MDTVLFAKKLDLDPSGESFTYHFSIYAPEATAVTLCLVTLSTEQQLKMRRMTAEPRETGTPSTAFGQNRDDLALGYWTLEVPNICAGQQYGFRVDGVWNPAQGLLFNKNKLLLDVRAKQVTGKFIWDDALLANNDKNSTSFVPKSVVCANYDFNWQGAVKPNTAIEKTIIYECHLKGMTQLNTKIPEHLRGTYLGFCHPVMLSYYKRLGITALELLPIHSFISEQHLTKEGLQLSNYWGYNTLSYFAPHAGYAVTPGEEITEFKTMVRALHAAGLEVILDVVYNHTAESGHQGPHLHMRGQANNSYYRYRTIGHDSAAHNALGSTQDKSIIPEPNQYTNYTGCGNTINVFNAEVQKLITDSLLYWANEMQVDGFRLDLGLTLARGEKGEEIDFKFLSDLQNHQGLKGVKWFTEPWDLGPQGYQLGGFPKEYSEWNDRFRDDVRAFWLQGGRAGDIASRICGSEDLLSSKELPCGGVNFITAHDGFTLNDLVRYNNKHNLKNGEENRDGCSYNRSNNFGIEGDTAKGESVGVAAKREVNKIRAKQQRNLLATLLLSRGVPMLSHGDERGRTQQGNNNVYCQDNELSWVDWSGDDKQFNFIAYCIALRNRFSQLFTNRYFSADVNSKRPEIYWLNPKGKAMSYDDWEGKALTAMIPPCMERVAKESEGECLILLINNYPHITLFTLPHGLFLGVERGGVAENRKAGCSEGGTPPNSKWSIVLDTESSKQPVINDDEGLPCLESQLKVAAHSLILLKSIP